MLSTIYQILITLQKSLNQTRCIAFYHKLKTQVGNRVHNIIEMVDKLPINMIKLKRLNKIR